MCGNCKYFKPVMDIPHGLDSYGYCCCPHSGFRNERRYDYTAACKHGEITEQY